MKYIVMLSVLLLALSPVFADGSEAEQVLAEGAESGQTSKSPDGAVEDEDDQSEDQTHEGSQVRHPLLSPDDVENQITSDREANPLWESKLFAPLKKWREQVAEKTGFHWSVDFTALLVGVNDSPGEDSASSGMVRVFGFWDLVNRGGPNKGTLNWKVENRHGFSDIPPSSLGFESGYLGLIGAPFSDEQTRLTNLDWKQHFADGKWTFVGGFLYTLGYVDVYQISSPWSGFTNFMFATGSAAMDLPNDAALGAGVAGLLGEKGKMYVQAGFVDANSDPTDPFSDVWKGNDFFKWVEIGLTPGRKSFYSDKIHLTYWHVDEREDATPGGWGLNASWHTTVAEKWHPFIRGGYTEDSGSLLERSISTGFGYQHVPNRGLLGFGFNWGRANEASFGDLADQYTTELFWRYQTTTELAISPTIQYVKDPALNPAEDSLWFFGLRLRVAV